MSDVYKRGIYLYINGKEVENNIKSIKSEITKLENAQAKMTLGTKEYIETGKRIRALKAIMSEHHAQLKKTESGWFSLKRAADGFNRYFGLITSFVAGLTGVVLGFRKAVDTANQFEERLDNLSALTGLEGSELKWLGDMAKETSVKITETGIRIKQSASDIVDAYTKMGSQRPELLKNKAALAAVTEDAIILSEAAKMELGPATAALATTMNQFNTSASESRRIINILAAGSKEGAAEIPYLTEALEKSGTTANMMGLSIEQTIGLIEAVAPKFAEARIAGTGFDRVLLNMRKNNIGYKDGVFDLNRALDELRIRYASGQSAVDLFGVEHAKMAEVMLQAQGDYNKYTKAVTDTNVAIEQASINTNNNNAKLAQARNKLQLLTIEFGEKLAPAMTFSTNTFNYFLKALIAAPEWIRKNQILLISLVGAFLAYNGALIKAIASQALTKLGSLQLFKAFRSEAIAVEFNRLAYLRMVKQQANLNLVQRGTIALQSVLNTVMKANPIGLAIAGLTALVAGIQYWSTHNKKAIALETEKNKIISESVDKNNALAESYKSISGAINSLSTMSVQEKKDLQDKIDKTIELAESEYLLLENRRNAIYEDSKKLNWWQWLWTGGASPTKEDLQAEMRIKNAAKAITGLDDSLQKMRDNLDSLQKSKVDLSQILNAESLGDAIKEETVSDLEEKLSRYQTALKNAAIGGEDYRRIQHKISEVQSKLAKARDVDDIAAKLDKEGKAFDVAREKMALFGNLYGDFVNSLKRDNEDLDESISELLKDTLDQFDREEGLFGPSLQDKQNMADYQYWLESTYEGQKELEKQRLAEGLIGYQQYADNIKRIDQAKRDAQIQNLEHWAGAAMDLFKTASMFQEAQMNRELAAAGNNTKKREEIERKYRQRQKAWAIAQAIIEGAIEVARINSNAGVNADLTQTLRIVLTAMAVARTAGQVALISSQQFAKGKYPVVGDQTGRTYQAAFVGPVRTGIYRNPSLGLFSEHEPETVIDGPTTRNIQANYPWIMRAIHSARVGQYASGKYSDPVASAADPNAMFDQMAAIMMQQNQVLNRLTRQLEQGISAPIVYTEFEKKKNLLDSIRSETSMSV